MANSQKGFANIILVVVIVILASAVGYFAFVKKLGPIVQQSTPTPTQTKTSVSPMPTPTQKDGTADWKIFTHSRDGYSLKYPSDKLGGPRISSAGDSGSGWIWSAEIGYPDRLGAFAGFFTFNGLIDSSIDAYYKGNSRIQITSTQNTTVNGKQAKIVLWKDINNSQSPIGKQYFIQYANNKVLIVSGFIEALFDQVVATLQF